MGQSGREGRRCRGKGHAYWYFETMKEYINPALYARVIIECIAVKAAELRGIPFQGGA